MDNFFKMNEKIPTNFKVECEDVLKVLDKN